MKKRCRTAPYTPHLGQMTEPMTGNGVMISIFAMVTLG